MFRLTSSSSLGTAASSSSTGGGTPTGGGGGGGGGGRRAKLEEVKRRLEGIYHDPSFTVLDLGPGSDESGEQAQRDGGVGDAGIRALSKLLLDCPKHHLSNLRVLDLSYNRMTDDGSGRDLAMALRQNVTLLKKNLQRVNLSHNLLTSSGTTLIMGGLTHLSSLRRIDLSHNGQLDDEAARAVATFLESTASPLQELDLGHNQLTGRGVMAIFYALGKTRRVATTLRTLVLEHNLIDTLESAPLAYALQSNSVLTEINLQQNPSMGMIGTAALINGLCQCPCPRKLRLAENGLGAVGIRAICPALAKSTSLLYLDLRDNDLGPRGAADIATLLLGPSNPYASRTALRELGLARNGIGSFGLKAIARALVRPANASTPKKSTAGAIRHRIAPTSPASHSENGTDNGNNNKDDKTTETEKAKDREPIISGGPFTAGNLLTFLDLRKNDVGASGALHLAEALGSGGACRLSRILLSANRIGDDGASALADALCTNDTVTYLGLQDNEITSQGAVALVEALLTTTTNKQEETTANGDENRYLKKRRKPSKLKCLMLEANRIGNIGARAMAQLIAAASPSLKTASHMDSSSSSSPTMLAPPLVSLTTLDLRDNGIGADGANAIADALRQVAQIRRWSEQHQDKHLLLEEEEEEETGGVVNNKKAHLLLEEQSRAASSKARQDLPALRVLHLCDNGEIGTVGAKAIAKALSKSGIVQLTMNHCGITDRVIFPMVRLYCTRNLADKRGTSLKALSPAAKKSGGESAKARTPVQQQQQAGSRRGSVEQTKNASLLGGLFQKRSVPAKPAGPVSTAPSSSSHSGTPFAGNNSNMLPQSSTFVPSLSMSKSSSSSDLRRPPIFPFYAKLMDRDRSRGNVHRKLTELLPLLGDVHQMKIYYTTVATFWRLGALTAEERVDYIVEAIDHTAETCRDAASMADFGWVLQKAQQDGNLLDENGMEDKYRRILAENSWAGGIGGNNDHHSEFVKVIGLAVQYNTSHIDSLEENILALKTAVRNVRDHRRGSLYKARFEAGICFVGTVLNLIASLSSNSGDSGGSGSAGDGSEPSLLEDVSAEIAVALLGRVVDFGDVTHVRAVADSTHAVEALRALHDGGAAYSLRMNDDGFFAALRDATDPFFLLGATNAMLRTEEGQVVSIGSSHYGAETPPSSSSSLALHHKHGPETDTSTVTESELGTDEQLGEAASVSEQRPSTIVTKKANGHMHKEDDEDHDQDEGGKFGTTDDDDFEDANDDTDGDEHQVEGGATTWNEKEFLEQIKDGAYVEEVDEDDEELEAMRNHNDDEGYVPKTARRRRDNSNNDNDEGESGDDESTKVRRRRIVSYTQEGKEEDPDVGFDTDDEDEFPLHAAIKYGIKEVLEEELESGEDANRLDPKGRSPADFAALRGELDMLRLIQDHGGSFRMGGMAKMQTKAFDKLSSKNDAAATAAPVPTTEVCAPSEIGDKAEF